MSAPIHAGQSDAVAGAISFRDGQTLVRYWQNADVAYYLVFCRAMVGLNFSTGVFFGNFAFRRADYLAFGFGKIGPALTEDLSFAKALHANGKAITFDPSSLIDVEACGNLRTLLERTLRISAGSVSILSVFLAGWLLLFVILAIAAALLGGVWTMLFVIRYCVGVAVVVLGLSGTRQYSLFPFALFQETLSIFLAMAAGVLILRGSKVVWGGNAYDR
jgi:cellulose synthase/poly-beta-1,6-N-acetylglucosamine synthase-like glycosyltransferase